MVVIVAAAALLSSVGPAVALVVLGALLWRWSSRPGTSTSPPPGVAATGVVVGYGRVPDPMAPWGAAPGGHHEPLVRFVTGLGFEHTGTPRNAGTYRPLPAVGDEVPLYYRHDRPRSFVGPQGRVGPLGMRPIAVALVGVGGLGALASAGAVLTIVLLVLHAV